MKWWKSRFVEPVLMGLIAIGLATGPASSAPLTRVSVETDGLGLPAISVDIRRALPGYLAMAFAEAGRDDFPAGARLVIRVTEVYLASSPDGDDVGSLSTGDAMEGEARLLDAQGRVLLRKRVSGRATPSPAGFGSIVTNERRRIDALLQSFAYWAARSI
jgi:hypothetical protein